MTLLRASALRFGYGGHSPIIDLWSEDFRGGEVVAITGPSGRGKSTLLYLLGLMHRPQQGRVILDGVDCTMLSDARRAHLRANLFGFVFQDAALDATRSVLDNVLETSLYRGVPKSASVARARYLLDRFDVELRAEAKPGQVSGGQAQRIALCRSLMNDPRVLLADEPTGNLDRSSAKVVTEALHDQARKGASVIVVTHDLDLANQCHRIVEL